MNVFLKTTVACLFLSLACHAYAQRLSGTVPTNLDAGRLKSEIRRIIRDADADVGVAVIPASGQNGANAGNDRKSRPYIIRINDFRRYPLMSVMKMHQALYVTDSLSRAGLPLETCIGITGDDLKSGTYSPLRDSLTAAWNDTGCGTQWNGFSCRIPIRTLLRYTLQLSDNNACDILFRHFSGPSATDAYIRTLGIKGFSVKVTEEQMHQDPGLCRKNRSRPSSAAMLLWMMVSADKDSPGCRSDTALSSRLAGNRYLDFILRTMMECTTGQDRLAAPLTGTDALIGHKTGTGDTDGRGRITGLNDIGFIVLPDGRCYTLAVFVRSSRETPTTTAKIIADISETVYRYMAGNGKSD